MARPVPVVTILGMLAAMLVMAVTPAPARAAARPNTAVATVAGANDGDGSSSAEAQALVQAANIDHRVEVPADNTETETVYANPNGSLTAEISQAPVRVPDSSGELVPIDTSLSADSGRLTPAAVAEDVSFSGTGAGTLAQMDPAGPTSFGLDFADGLDAPTVHGDSASFPVSGSDPATVSVAATTLGFSAHVLVPAAPTTAPVYTFPLELHGLHAALQNNQLMLTDDNGKLVASSAPLQMWDARRDAGGDPANVVPVDASLVSTPDGGQALQLKPSMDYLTAADTQYPVTIDPDVTASRAGDTYLTSQYPDGTRSDYYAVRVGSADGTNKWRAIEAFYIDRYLGETVQSATLKMYQYYAATCANETTNVYAADADSDPALPYTWNNQPTIKNDARYNSTYTGNVGASGCPGAQQSIDVTAQTSAYVSGQIGSNFNDADGSKHHEAFFELRAANELATSQEKRFCSMNTGADGAVPACATAGTHEPVLAITYAPDLGTLGSYSLTSHKLNDRSTLEVNNDNGNGLVKAQDVHVKGVGQDLSLTRWYNSLATGTTTSLGTAGWSLSGGPDVYLQKISAYSYNYHAPDGHIYGPYTRSSTAAGETGFDEPTNGGANADLKDNNDGTFTLTFHSSQTKYKFSAIGSSGNLYLSHTNDRSGNNPITYTYGSGTQLSSITDTAGRQFDVTYNPAGYISQITDTNVTPARTWQYSYDSNGNLTSYTDPTGATTSYDYTSGSPYYLSKITDPAQLTGEHTGDHPTTVLGYGSGQVTSVQYQNGTSGGTPTYYKTIWAYHSNLTDDTLGGSSCDSDADRYTRLTDSNSHDTLYCFKDRTNKDDKTIDAIDALGHHRKSTYTTTEQPSSITSPEDSGVSNGSTAATYGIGDGGTQDQLDTVTEPTDNADPNKAAKATIRHHADSSIAGYKYLPTSKVSGNLRCTAYTYYTSGGGQGLVKDAYIGLDPGTNLDCSGTTGADAWHNVYNSHGSILASWDPNGADVSTHDGPDETVYSYDSVGQLISVRKPGGTCGTGYARDLCTSYTYDGDGRIATKTDGRGEKTTYSYDGDDRTTQLLLHGATTCVLTSADCIQYTYDGEGNLATRTDQHGTTTLSYDLLNQQHTQDTPDGTNVTTVYDGEANLTSYQQSVQNGSTTDDDTVSYSYNAADQVTKVSDSTGDITISPNKDGKPDVIHFPTTSHPLSVNYDYFHSGKTKSIHVTDAGNDKLPSYDYSYTTTIGGVSGVETDELQTTTVSTANGNSSLDGTITYDYGSAERLTSATDTSGSGQGYSYDYNPAGQLRSMTAGSTTTYFGYDEADNLCWSGPNDGTKVAQTCPSTPSGDTTISHDAAGENTGSTGNANSYDPDQRATNLHGVPQSYFDHGNDLRATSGTDSTTISYATGPLGVTARTTNAGTTFYTRDPNGNLLDEHGAAGTSYYLTNYQHSVMALVSASGDTFNGAYFYGPYGETNVEARGGGTTADNNPWRYAGGYQDTLEGDNYYHFGARYYSPTQGRWTQADPKPGSLNDPASLLGYGYAGDDPVNHADPSGTISTGLVIGLVLGGAAVAAAGGILIAGAGAIAGVLELAGIDAVFGTIGEAGTADVLGVAGIGFGTLTMLGGAALAPFAD